MDAAAPAADICIMLVSSRVKAVVVCAKLSAVVALAGSARRSIVLRLCYDAQDALAFEMEMQSDNNAPDQPERSALRQP